MIVGIQGDKKDFQLSIIGDSVFLVQGAGVQSAIPQEQILGGIEKAVGFCGGDALGGGNLLHLFSQAVKIRLTLLWAEAQSARPVRRGADFHHALGAQVQRHGAGDHHQGHGAEDADVGKPHGVALHPVEHAGDGDKMAGLIVIALVLLENLQEGDAPSGEEAVGADDDEEHREKIVGEGLHGIGDPQSDIVPAAQGHKADERQKPLSLGLFFSGASLAHHGDGVLPSHADEVEDQVEQEHRAKEDGGDGNAQPGDVEGKTGGEVDHPVDDEGQQPLEEHAEENAAHHAGEAEDQRLPDEHGGDVALAHAQNVVEPQLLVPPLHEKAVGVEEEDHRKDAHEKHADAHEYAQILIANPVGKIRRAGQGEHDIEDGGGEENGEKVGKVKFTVVFQALPGELGVEGFHALSPPAVSTVRASVIFP